MDDFAQARDLLRQAGRVAVLTGAGISTASGIGDFRGPQGRWTLDPDAEKVSTLSWYLSDPQVRAKAWRLRAESPVYHAQPNPAHRALVGLEQGARLTGLVTQNTDGLHQLAGSNPELVIELHGNSRTWRCESCRATGPMDEMVRRVRSGEVDPRCRFDGGIVRATTILFEEGLHPNDIDAAVASVDEADVLLVIGTSLRVHPAAGLLPYARRRGVLVVIVNAQPTDYDRLADTVLRDPIVEVVPALLRPDDEQISTVAD
ncbi:SIR2 family NAD-dependent protein deacylase [Micropruina sp.]|uniref:SIR2 family NAD-dependent protein deacylase n=1 Tax=Micropruina sp. TaxID=2737536 RepID=UPI0039E6175F